MKKEFTKSDLQYGMVVEFRNGDYGMYRKEHTEMRAIKNVVQDLGSSTYIYI